MRGSGLAPVAVASLALCAWLHARGVGALMGERLGAPEIHVVTPAWAAPPPPAERSADPILARNAFDSVTGPLIGRPAPSGDPGEPPGAAGAPPCEGVRVAAVVADGDPDWSLAMLEIQGRRGPVLRKRGGEVVAIGVGGVLLERGGKRCVARLFTPAVAAGPPAPAASFPGIAVKGPGEVVLDRAARDALIDGATELMRVVRVRPEKVGDEVVGIRLDVLKPGSALDALGLRTGDVLTSVDGVPLTSPDRLLEAYARLRTASHVRLNILRDSAPRQLDYDVR
jgi:general secretion pathway protein C